MGHPHQADRDRAQEADLIPPARVVARAVAASSQVAELARQPALAPAQALGDRQVARALVARLAVVRPRVAALAPRPVAELPLVVPQRQPDLSALLERLRTPDTRARRRRVNR